MNNLINQTVLIANTIYRITASHKGKNGIIYVVLVDGKGYSMMLPVERIKSQLVQEV
jgi:hypothetical protein